MDVDMKVVKGKRKRKNVKKKGGIIKKQDVKLQSKNLEKVTGNLNTNVGKILNKKPDSKMTTKKDSEGGKKDSEGEEQTNTDSEENVDTQDPPKPKRPKRRNRELNVPSGKMELTPLLTQETDGRTSHRDERTLYVRFPPSLCSVRDKAYLETLVPSAVDIRLPRLSPGNYAKFCYIEFDTEEETTRMRETLATIKINGEAFFADYVGKKSKTQSDKEPRTVDPLRLYVGGLPKGIKGEDIRAAFPTAGRMMYRKANNKFSVRYDKISHNALFLPSLPTPQILLSSIGFLLGQEWSACLVTFKALKFGKPVLQSCQGLQVLARS
ncbi:nucleolin [Chionoecetes opilio]|uniref:Nucleolin n=1 Tax=Chionoecetes opilio TaxID=41210 RepID=A0A8J4XKP0_CHIOP|nr:nucleolin [Chionoecetes opilio]